MKLGSRVGQGAFAGLSGGIGVALFFLVGDVIQVTPLSTPMALGTTFLGPGGTSVDFPVVAQALTLASAGDLRCRRVRAKEPGRDPVV